MSFLQALSASRVAALRNTLLRPPALYPWLTSECYLLLLLVSSARRHACVKLLCELGLYEDAVPLALAVELGLAKAVANSPEDDDALRRKLWLSIAKHVVQVRVCLSGSIL